MVINFAYLFYKINKIIVFSNKVSVTIHFYKRCFIGVIYFELVSFIGHVIAWFHMQGQFKYEWAKSFWWIALGGVPISFCFYYGTRWYYEFFGNYWYVRPIGFGMATLIFGILTWIVLNELPDTRTIISLILSVIIIILQLSHLIIK